VGEGKDRGSGFLEGIKGEIEKMKWDGEFLKKYTGRYEKTIENHVR